MPFYLSEPETSNLFLALHIKHFQEIYIMTAETRGLAYIINNCEFPGRAHLNLKNTKRDVSRLKHLFDKLHFETKIRGNKKAHVSVFATYYYPNYLSTLFCLS